MIDGSYKIPTIRAMVSLAVTAALFAALALADADRAYLWIKAFHVVAVIAWMAGMFYLPRLFVYHAGVAAGSEASELFKVMERKLLRVIINPAMVTAWATGTWLAWRIFAFEGGWLWGKIALVTALSAVHGYLSVSVRVFARDRNVHSHVWWRAVNEIPTVLLIGIVILVILKPF